MVVISGVGGDSSGFSAKILEAVSTGELRLAISDAQLSELVRVFFYPEVESLIGSPGRAFEAGLGIGYMGIMHRPRRHDWSSLSDPGDSWIFDLAHASGAAYIVTYDGAVRRAAERLGFECVLPEDLLHELRRDA